MTSSDPAAPGVSSLHDVELAALAAAGERQAYGELARRHGAGVRRLLRRLGAPPGAADSLARDAFVGAFDRVAEFRGEGTFSAWIRREAARLYLRRTRSERARWPRSGEPSPREWTAPGSGGAEEGTLDAALEALGALERLCVGLNFGAGFAPREIGELLGLPPDAVRTRLHTGLQRLRSELALAGVVPERDPHG